MFGDFFSGSRQQQGPAVGETVQVSGGSILLEQGYTAFWWDPLCPEVMGQAWWCERPHAEGSARLIRRVSRLQWFAETTVIGLQSLAIALCLEEAE